MKLIIAPTDFSKISRNVVNYAAEIARRAGAKLVILHAYHPPVIISEAPVILPIGDLANDCMKELRKIRSALLARHGRLFNVELSCTEGFAIDVICSYAREHKADLVVAGTHGAGYLEEKLIGTVTSGLIARCKTPVLSIAAKIKFKSIKKVVLATDYLQLSNPAILGPLKEMAGLFHSHIYILNVIKKAGTLPTVSQAVEGIRLEQMLSGQDHSFHSVTNTDIVKGINNFTEARHMDLVVMIPRRHNFFKTLFHKRNTKAMAFQTQTPLLTIHN